MATVTHVTHEALDKIGGIGAVLEGLINADTYQKEIKRTFLVGPIFVWNPEEHLIERGEVLYSRVTGVDKGHFGAILGPVEQRYGTRIVYGKRRLIDKITGRVSTPEIVLVDPGAMDPNRTAEFKFYLYEKLGLSSQAYEHVWDYEQYMRIASPGFDAILALLGQDEGPHTVIAHEYMGLPFAFKTMMSGDRRFKTVFHAHEAATVRPIVEDSLGHDTMFYNVLDAALARGIFVDDLFGSQDHYFKHAWVGRAHLCDRVFAVGDFVVKELKFLNRSFAAKDIDLVYNGLPHISISLEEKRASKAKLQRYAKALLGYSPDLVFTHVTRLVKSKGVWRDLRVLEHMDELLQCDDKRAVLFLLSTQNGGGRPPEDVLRMEKEYGWPLDHRMGWPDLDGYEADLHAGILSFNQKAKNVKIVFVNQFGWTRERCGLRMPEDMEFADIRKGPDVEFGQSVYEPFGIAQLEPLSFGAICVPTNVCGCTGFVQKVTWGKGVKNVIVADYTTMPVRARSLWDLLAIGLKERNEVEDLNSMKVASMIFAFLPRTEAEEEAMVQKGFDLASHMSWEVVARDYFLPGLEKA